MAAGDIIIPGNTITPEILQQIAAAVEDLIASTAKDPGQYREATTLLNLYSLPSFEKSGSAWELVLAPISLLKGKDGKSAFDLWKEQPGNTDKTITDFFNSLKGEKGDPFVFDDFTTEQLEGLSLTFEKLTPEQIQMFWNKIPEDVVTLFQQPATDAATEVRQQMDGITQEATQLITTTTEAKDAAIQATEKAQSVSDHPGYIGEDYHVYTWDYATGAYNKTDTVLRPEGFSIFRTYPSIDAMNADKANVPEGKFVLINTGSVEDPDTARLYVKGPADFDYLVDMSGAIGFTGKTPQITIGTVTVGQQASATLSPDGTDDAGNPRFKLNLVIVAGPQGLMPVIELGTVSTGQPGTNASATFEQNGQTADGRDKYLLNLTIPQGMPGTGSGNVLVDASGIMVGKKYLFVPNSDGSPVGAFVEYAEPSVATAEKAGLMSPEQFQKLEELSIGGNIITIPDTISGLTSESTSDEIFAVFGGADKLAEIAEKLVLGKYILRMGSDESYCVIALTEVSFTDANNYNIGLSFSFSNIVSYFDINVAQGIATANSSIGVFPVMESGTLEDGYYVNNVERGNFANQKSLSTALTELGITGSFEVPSAIIELTNDSTSEEIKTAIGQDIGFDALCQAMQNDNSIYISIGDSKVFSTKYDVFIDSSSIALNISFAIDNFIQLVSISRAKDNNSYTYYMEAKESPLLTSSSEKIYFKYSTNDGQLMWNNNNADTDVGGTGPRYAAYSRNHNVKIENTGDGTKALMDDGTYKEITSGNTLGLDITPLLTGLVDPSQSFVITQEMFDSIVEAYTNRYQMAYTVVEGMSGYFTMNIVYNTANARFCYDVSLFAPIAGGRANGYCDYNVINFEVYEDDKSTTFNNCNIRLFSNGIGNRFLSDDGGYKEITVATTSANGLLRQLNGSTTSFMRGDGTWATPPDTTYSPATQSANGLMSAADKKKLDRLGSKTTATTVANLDVNYETILVTLSANASLSANLTGASYDTWETHVFVQASGGDRTITIPTTGNYISMCGSNYTCPAGKWVEFNLKCIGGIWHIAKLEQE